jgi:predicted DNA binding CopG/RHH family protein
MKRSQKSELAERINLAFTLLKKELPDSQIVNQLMEKFGVSKIQAYRYVQQAKSNKEPMAVPETSIVFTVKLPPSLINQIRSFASFKGMSISRVVRTALEDFLAKIDHGQKTETS